MKRRHITTPLLAAVIFACLASGVHAQDTVSIGALHREVTELRREVAELRGWLRQIRVASLEYEQAQLSSELAQLQQQEAEIRERVDNFDRQLASSPLGGDERAQAESVRSETGGRTLEDIAARRAALAARLAACSQQLANERRLNQTGRSY